MAHTPAKGKQQYLLDFDCAVCGTQWCMRIRTSSLVPLLLLVVFAALLPARVMTPKDVAALRSVVSAKISPDGKFIAYVLLVPRKLFEEDDGPAWTELHVWDETRGSRPFVTGQVNVSAIDWTPDGKGISFLAKRGKDKARSLYVIPIDGGEARKVLEHETGISGYAWLGDGSQVVFRAPEKLDKEREKLKKKGFKQEIFEEDLRYTRAWIATLNGDKPQKRRLELEGTVNGIYPSPDGKLLAVKLAPKPLVDHSYMYTRVHVVRASDGSLVYKIDNPGKLGAVRWSPDSRHVALVAGADEHDPNAGRLFLADVEAKTTGKFFLEDEGDVAGIAWKDNRTLLYTWDHGVETELRSFDIVTKKWKTVARRAWPSMDVCRRTGRVAFLGDTPAHPRELFILDPGSGEPRRVTDSNPWLKEIRLAKQEVIEFQARDGLKLQGMLIHPLDEKPGQRYPLIIVVHGGPESHYRNGWLTSYTGLGQVAAARGFAVFYPNYRASTGRGVAFSKLDFGRPAMEEFDDIVDAAKHLVRMGLVDEKKVGVTGGSYGGYATAWCSTALSEHFAAGVMFVGISDKISKLGATDIPDEVYLVHDRYRLWENWDLFLKQSPIYYVEKARTPLLILHGKADPRVPPLQSLELYRHLKTLGKVPVRLVWYPGEGHGNRRAAARYDYNLRALRWFEHYLKGKGGDPPDRNLDYGFDEKKE